MAVIRWRASVAIGLAVLSTLALSQLVVSQAHSSTAGVIATDWGLVHGKVAGQTYAFLGVPFAAPPTGTLRWQPPVAPTPWLGERPTTAFGPACPQVDDDGHVLGDEDCLYLNVWTPLTATGSSNLPVLVFIHGGGNVQGSASITRGGGPAYDGQALAEKQSVVVVTLQYRLGALGYLVHPALAAESAHGSAGNYGLLDQLAALRWVQRNIRAFGGDPARVLLFGQSGGAIDTCMLLTSPLADGLFSASLMQSGSCGAATAAVRESEGVDLATKVNCTGTLDLAACLRAVPTTTLVTVIDTTPISNGLVTQAFGPNIDGYVLPHSPWTALLRGERQAAPIIVGANADEMLPTVISMTQPAYTALVYLMFGLQTGNQVLDLYPVGLNPGEYATPREAFAAINTDAQFICPARRMARLAATHSPVYRYFFTQRLDSPLYGPGGAAHGLEIPFVFQHLDDLLLYTPSPADRALETALGAFWTNFAAGGNPNEAGLITWPVYDGALDNYLNVGTPLTTSTGVRTTHCDFWDDFAQPVLSVRQGASASPIAPGAALTFTLDFGNAAGTATNVIATDTLPAHVTFVAASAGGQYQNGQVVWSLGTLTFAQRVTRTVQVTLEALPGNVVTNTVMVAAAEGGSDEQTLTLVAGGRVYLPLMLR